MIPVCYTTHQPKFTWETGLVYKYHYKFSDIRAWIKEKGGLIIVESSDKYTVSRGFWSLNGPSDKIITFRQAIYPVFDGGPVNPENVVNPKPFSFPYGFLIPQGKISNHSNKRKIIKYGV